LTGPADPELRSVPWRSGTLTFTSEGDPTAPAVIAVHGLPGSVRDFRYLGPLLAPHVYFVRLELPGFGGSTWQPEAVGFDGRAHAVLALADQLGLRRFAALGHSMGGGTALAVAAQAPERVSALVLLSSVALRRHRALGLPQWAFTWASYALRVPVLGHVALHVARAQYRRRGFAVSALSRLDVSRHLQAIAATDFDRLRQIVRGPLPPTLVAYAEDDPLVETPVSEELAAALPTARVLRFAQGGHNLQKSRAAELAVAIRELLAAQKWV
jgi:pimeloyl-ACP methyl ester carboxylesterase